MTQPTPPEAELFLDDLIVALGFENEAEDKKQALKHTMSEELGWELWRTLTENVEPEVITYLQTTYPNQKNPQFLISQAIQHSPATHAAIEKTIQDYAKEVLQDAIMTA